MFLTILSLLALLVVAHGFLRVVRYFWQWLGYDVDLDRAVAGGYVSAEVALAAEGDKRALTAEQRRELALGRERMREEFLDRLRIGWYQVVYKCFDYVHGGRAYAFCWNDPKYWGDNPDVKPINVQVWDTSFLFEDWTNPHQDVPEDPDAPPGKLLYELEH